MRETADINESNNTWPAVQETGKFKLFKAKVMALRAGGSGKC
jgi:hypothetical protein